MTITQATGPSMTTADGTQIYFKDWGPSDGQPVVFCHGWPLNADSWDSQMTYLAERGYRCVAHDRRGHGRSSQPWRGNEMDTYADDLATLIDSLDLRDVVLIVSRPAAAKWQGTSAGTGRYIPAVEFRKRR